MRHVFKSIGRGLKQAIRREKRRRMLERRRNRSG
jgi:hypothetical protein